MLHQEDNVLRLSATIQSKLHFLYWPCAASILNNQQYTSKRTLTFTGWNNSRIQWHIEA